LIAREKIVYLLVVVTTAVVVVVVVVVDVVVIVIVVVVVVVVVLVPLDEDETCGDDAKRKSVRMTYKNLYIRYPSTKVPTR
jgi:hypothetical protein